MIRRDSDISLSIVIEIPLIREIFESHLDDFSDDVKRQRNERHTHRDHQYVFSFRFSHDHDVSITEPNSREPSGGLYDRESDILT